MVVMISAVSTSSVCLASAQEAEFPQIVPGVGIGPVRLGMAADEGTRTAARFAIATDGCTIDVLVIASRVVAAGTRWGGCLDLALPRGARPVGVSLAGTVFRAWPAIGSTPFPFVAVFGQPIIVPFDNDSAALIWRNGLVALVEGIRDGDGVVTYLAVTRRGSEAVPQVGLLKISGNSCGMNITSSGNCGDATLRCPRQLCWAPTLARGRGRGA